MFIFALVIKQGKKMKLIVEVSDYLGEVDVYQYFKSDPDESRVVGLTQQAESVARLAEVAKEIEKTAKAYYAKNMRVADTKQ